MSTQTQTETIDKEVQKSMTKPYRKRSNRLEFYLSDDEYRVLLESTERSGLSLSEHCRQLIKTGKVTAAPPADFRRLIWELKRIGTNLDQVLFRLNSIGDYDQDDLKNCIDEIQGAIRMLNQTFKSTGGG